MQTNQYYANYVKQQSKKAAFTPHQIDKSLYSAGGFDRAKFQYDFFTTGPGHGGNIELFNRYFRVVEITDPKNWQRRVGLIDHHLAVAWLRAWQYADNNFASYGFFTETPRVICKEIMARPERLRDRLDAVFAGMALAYEQHEIYEFEFKTWEREWYDTMTSIYQATNGKPARRLSLYRQEAAEMYPALITWFERLRYDVLGGGSNGNWLSGDRVRQDVEAGSDE